MPPKKKSATTSDPVYQPLKGYKVALDSLKDELDEEEFAQYKKAIRIYSSCSDITKLSKEESTQVFPAVFHVGDTFIQNESPQGLQWFVQALIIGENMEPIPEFAQYYLEMADIFDENGVTETAMECVEPGLKIINQVEEAQLDDNKKYVKGRLLHLKGMMQDDLQNQAGPLQKMSLAKEAIETLTQSAALLEGIIGGSYEFDATCLVQIYEMLVSTLLEIKDYPQGILYAKKCLDLIDKVLGVNDFRGNHMAYDLAKTLAEERKFDEAMVYAKKYEEITIKEEGPDTPTLASCYNLYGLIGSRSGDYKNALENIEKAEELAKKTPDATPERFEERFIEKTRCHFNLGNFKEAKECFDESVKYNKTYGSDNKKMANCYYAGAEILKGSKLFIAETKDNYLKALAIYRELYFFAYAETVTALINFGAFLHENGEFLETIKLLLEAKETCEKWLTHRKDLLESCYNVLGMAQVFAGESHYGLHNLEEAVKICEETGDESGKLTFHYFNLAKACSTNNEFEKALVYGKKIMQKELATNGKDSQWVHATIDLLATVFTQMTPEQLYEELAKNS